MKRYIYLHRVFTCLLTLCLLFAGTVEGLPVHAAPRRSAVAHLTCLSGEGSGLPDGQCHLDKADEFMPGVGLGLPLARLYAQRIRATVWLDTSSPSPTCFVISLPAPDAAELPSG